MIIEREMTVDDAGFDDAMLFGTGYALYRHGQDRLAADIAAAVRAALSEWEPVLPGYPSEVEDPGERSASVSPVDLDSSGMPEEWEDYIGQDDLIEELRLRVDSVNVRRGRLPHMLLSSDRPGMGRRTAVRLATRQLGKHLIELPAPFTLDALVSAAEQLSYGDVLFLEDLDLACVAGAPGPGVLAWMLENSEVLGRNGTRHFLDEVAVLASTTSVDAVPPSVLDGFSVHIAMAPYSPVDLARLAVASAFNRRSEDIVTDELAVHIAVLSAGTGPAHVDRMVLLVRDLAVTLGRSPEFDEIVHASERWRSEWG